MPVKNYGVLKGRVRDAKSERDNNSPHYQILVEGEENKKYRVAVNVMSISEESELLYFADDEFDGSAITHLQSLDYGYTKIDNKNREIALDYIRGNLIKDRKEMKPISHHKFGESNDLSDFMDSHIQVLDNTATIYVFGSKFGPEEKEDKVFEFKPALGMHNVHMNQGNYGRFEKDNGIWQDGGILIEEKGKWTAVFLAFLTQSWCTDDKGNPEKKCSYKD